MNYYLSTNRSGRELKPRTPPRLAPLHRSQSAENVLGDRIGDKKLTPPGTACGHPQAGQELCYLCHQRARRNVPVSFTDERRRREEEEDRLLQQYQTMRDAEDILREQVELLSLLWYVHTDSNLYLSLLPVFELWRCHSYTHTLGSVSVLDLPFSHVIVSFQVPLVISFCFL